MPRLCWAVAAGAALLCLAAAGCRPGQTAQPAANAASEAPAAQAAPRKVKLLTAELRTWPKHVHVQGSLLPDERAVVGAKVAGRVGEVKIDLGSLVRKGDVLVTLDAEELELGVQQAEAQLEQALAHLGLKPTDSERQLDPKKVPAVVQEMALRNEAKARLERAQSLFTQHALSFEELQDRQAAVEVAESKCLSALNAVGEQVALVGVRRTQLALAKQLRHDAVVRAPMDGVIEERYVAPGSYLQLGQSVVTMVKTDPLRFRGGVPEREASRVAQHQSVHTQIEGQAEPVAGKVTRVSPAVTSNNRALLVEVDIPNPNMKLRVGLFAEAEIVVEPEAKALVVPAAAVSEFAGVEKVWLVQESVAQQAVVLTGRREPDRIEILSGLKPGDLVVADAAEGRAGPVVAEP